MAQDFFAKAPDQESVRQAFLLSQDELLARVEMVDSSMVVEPFTWGWVALKIAEGAIAWVGGQILGSLFGSGTDMGGFFRSVIAAMDAVVRGAIQENELRLISADLRTLQTDMNQYLAAPSGTDRLTSATASVSSTVSRLETLGLTGHGAYMAAISAQVVVLQERMKVFGEGEKTNIKSTLNRGITHAEEMHREWRNWHERRFEVVSYLTGLPNAPLRLWIAKRDGQNLRVFRSEADARSHARLNTEDIWENELVPKYIAPSNEVLKKWRELLATLSQV